MPPHHPDTRPIAWRNRAFKALSFAAMGLINTAVDATVFFLLLHLATTSLIVANTLSWLVAVTGSYVIISLTTFSVETGSRLRMKDYASFMGSGVLAMIAATAVFIGGAKLGPVWASKGVSILVSFAVNFFILQSVVFRGRDARPLE
mgnify:CR=1 FL=1